MPRSKTMPELQVECLPKGFAPTQQQIDAFARRLLPVIQEYFADEQVQREFGKWKEAQKAA